MLLAMLTISVILAAVPVMAGPKGADNNVGKHVFKINIIGRPTNWTGKDSGSSSNTIFISIKCHPEMVTCESSSYVDYSHAGEVWVPEAGQRIYFYSATTFEVVDRDATDGDARVTIPAPAAGYQYNISVRVLGGNNTKFPGCLEADAVRDSIYGEPIGTYYLIGTLHANRKPGTPEKVDVRGLFYTGSTAYFSDYYQDYFWSITNNGLRNMQLIFYEVPIV